MKLDYVSPMQFEKKLARGTAIASRIIEWLRGTSYRGRSIVTFALLQAVTKKSISAKNCAA